MLKGEEAGTERVLLGIRTLLRELTGAAEEAAGVMALAKGVALVDTEGNITVAGEALLGWLDSMLSDLRTEFRGRSLHWVPQWEETGYESSSQGSSGTHTI